LPLRSDLYQYRPVAAIIDPIGTPESRTRPDRFYLPELDGLRFFAFLSVFICHALLIVGASTVFSRMGAFGVDLFYALSAFLITELLMREREALGTIDVKSFYLRRILRIWPLYFAFLGSALIARLIYPGLNISWTYFVAFGLFVGNFAICWLPTQPADFIRPLWSVSIEEQFYLTWPLAVRHLSRRGVAVAAVVIWLSSIIVRLVLALAGSSYLTIAYSTFGRLDPLACGLLISALIGTAPPNWIRGLRATLYLAGVLLWLGAAFCLFYRGRQYMNDPLFVSIGYPAVALGSGAFLLATMGSNSFMRSGPLVYLGRISYGLYVFHEAMLVASNAILESLPGWQKAAACPLVALAATIMVAAASYRWLESPFLRMKARYQHIRSAAPVT
jgi:peptidoglycan/LPS O-acetylase OafA/YrhL